MIFTNEFLNSRSGLLSVIMFKTMLWTQNKCLLQSIHNPPLLPEAITINTPITRAPIKLFSGGFISQLIEHKTKGKCI